MARHPNAPAELFKPGDKVQVCHTRDDWRDAVIMSLAGYGGGYYYQYDPLPAKGADGYEASAGGWTCDRFCRALENT